MVLVQGLGGAGPLYVGSLELAGFGNIAGRVALCDEGAGRSRRLQTRGGTVLVWARRVMFASR